MLSIICSRGQIKCYPHNYKNNTIHARSFNRNALKCSKKPLYVSTFCRTNVLADYLDKFANDINIISLQSEEQEGMPSCKHIAMIQCVIILLVLLFMFFDRDKKDG